MVEVQVLCLKMAMYAEFSLDTPHLTPAASYLPCEDLEYLDGLKADYVPKMFV